MIDRAKERAIVEGLLSRHRAVAIVGARQVGKTTLANEVAARFRGSATVFDLEDPRDLARLSDPMLALGERRGLVVIDEIQNRPDLFPIIRVLADRRRPAVRFLLLGSASPGLIRRTSESLAGRVAYHELRGFTAEEVGEAALRRLWFRGGFPLSFLARSDRASAEWRREFLRTFLERDLPQLGIPIAAQTLRRFWSMLAHYHGQIWNASEFGRAFGVSDNTVRHYLDILEGTFVVRRLPPFHANLAKRQVKAPKIYIADGGILHVLLGIESFRDLEGHPKVGASWEGFALDHVVRHIGARPEEMFFWATHTGAEIDLLVARGRTRLGFEFKRTTAPSLTKSMHSALADLDLARLYVVHAGTDSFPLAPKVRAVALQEIRKGLKPLP
ncbi:MAG: ATP-binding protein [Planctomycetes bacterium]|nr:ATP-binding protein [Planctomycetota bacterium]